MQDRLKNQKMLFDGAFGTYYMHLYDSKELPEMANTDFPERVMRIHKEYIEAGADIIRTNTFASNIHSLNLSWEYVKENIKNGYRIASEAVKSSNAVVAADIGQISDDIKHKYENISDEYVKICNTFLEEGAKVFVFETFSDTEDILKALECINDKAFVIVQFSVNQYGYSDSGLSARKLIQKAEEIKWIDAVGFNCGVGPGHLQNIIKNISFSGKKYITALPNAGYPHIVGNRMMFDNRNIDYFVDKISDIAEIGADIVGGCCGTTPEFIRKIKEKVSFVQPEKKIMNVIPSKTNFLKKDYSFFSNKKDKLIAVELAPPLNSDDEKLMDAAHLLLKSGVDVLTFPDSPSGRTRADSILIAEKVARETGMCVMPHICCRDKNAIAIRSQLLGAHINNIHNFLVITGDPVPSLMRNNTKSVFQFSSTGLMQIMNDMNEEEFFETPIYYGGAINQGRRNIDVEIERVKKKISMGATFFLTQPIVSVESAERVRRIKNETKARILCGIMPFVSLKNVLFMKNEMSGIEVPDEVVMRYNMNMSKEEGEEAGIQLAKEMIELTYDFSDGYYFSFPFNRVNMLEKILG